MHFLQTDYLKPGVRLAGAIYGKQGEILFERGSRLTEQDVDHISRLKVFGVPVLDAAEPAPPMTEQEQELENFRAVTAAAVQEELDGILRTKRANRLTTVAENIIHSYGYLEKRIEFLQDVRSREDFVCKHMLNASILCTMISHIMNVRLDEQLATVQAALLHDVGRLAMADRAFEVGDSMQEAEGVLRDAQISMHPLIEAILPEGKVVRRICVQAQQAIDRMEQEDVQEAKHVTGAKILAVADMYDRMTAMGQWNMPMSAVAVLKHMRKYPKCFDASVLDALTNSIHFLKPGDSVVLTTGEKALVIQENQADVLRPVVISIADNSIIDLGDRQTYGDIEVEDVLKTLDNRVKIQ